MLLLSLFFIDAIISKATVEVAVMVQTVHDKYKRE